MTQFNGSDDIPLQCYRPDLSGGMNTRQQARQILETQVQEMVNYDISIPGEVRKDKGSTLVEELDAGPGTGLFGFEPSNGTNVLVAAHNQKLETWPGTGTFTERKTNFTDNLQTSIIKAEEEGEGEVFLVANGTDNWFRFAPSNYSSPQDLGSTAGTGTDSPPKSRVGVYHRNRLYVLKDNSLYFSTPFPPDYSAAFDTVADAFRMPVGEERALVSLREQGLIVVGRDQIWGINPSAVPDPTTDKPEKLLDIGCVAGATAVQVGDDVVFLAKDGVRGLFRTQQDKLQLGRSYSLSFIMKDEMASINWAYAHNACAIYYDGKYLIALPVDGSTRNNEVWIYYPANNSWRVKKGWTVARFATMRVSGEERLYYIDSASGKVCRAFYGSTNLGTPISSNFTGRQEDLGAPSNYKAGGELEVEYQTVNSAQTLSIYVSIDNGSFNLLGTINASTGNTPTLPINLPFYLTGTYRATKKFHLEQLGKWKAIQIKIEEAVDSTDDVVVYGYNIFSFKEEYLNE